MVSKVSSFGKSLIRNKSSEEKLKHRCPLCEFTTDSKLLVETHVMGFH